MSILKQFGLLLWKNYLLQKRKKLVTFLEIALPTFFALLLIAIRLRVNSTNVNSPTQWDPFSVNYLPGSLCPDKPLCPGRPWRLYYTPNTTLGDQIMVRVKEILGPSNISAVRGFSTEKELVDLLLQDLQKGSSDSLGGVVLDIKENDTLSGNIKYTIRLPSAPRNADQAPTFVNLLQNGIGWEAIYMFPWYQISQVRYTSQSLGDDDDPSVNNPLMQDTGWKTVLMFPLYQMVGPREKEKQWGGAPGYMREGFLSLQHVIDKSIILETSTDSEIPEDIDVSLKRFPFPPYNNDFFVIVIQKQLPTFIMLSFIFVALNVVKDVVHEKERRHKEYMKMMGLSNWLHWSTWFVKYLLFLIISVALMTVFFCIRTSHGRVIGYTAPSVLFVFLLIYSISTIMFCFAVSVFFSKANSGAAAGGILFFCSYIPYYFLQLRYNELSWWTKIGSSLINNVGMSYGGQIIGMFEGTGAGVQWSTINQSVSVDDDFTMLHIFIMLLLDSVIYGLIAWYVEAVFPGDYGIPKPWYFPVLKSYWCGRRSKQEDFDLSNLVQEDINKSEYFEKQPTGIEAGIKIKNLRKVFGKGPKEVVAVAGTTLNMYNGQITALLGHNGAGKTTTMSMLTGFLPPTSGTAIVNGYDINVDLEGVRKNLGLCPQHDVLFDTLTVEEHLVFFVKLKGFPSELIQDEVDRMVRMIGLKEKRHARSQTLSGGMKRKLSVGIALIGGSKVVVLDEPTSGMDPNARRHMWDLLQKNREGRTMLLSTHFMDEADLLGDRIAIMADGVIQCCGTSLFLKSKYGAGYHMVIVKEPGCDVNKITELITSYVPDAKMESNISVELAYILPHESSSQFEALFSDLERDKQDLKIASFGASVTTMEEVFLRVGENSDATLSEKLLQVKAAINTGDSGSATPGHSTPGHSTPSTAYEDVEGTLLQATPNSDYVNYLVKNRGPQLYAQQFVAMFQKRVYHTLRNLIITVAQILVPLFFTTMGLAVLKTMPGPQDSPALAMNISGFDESVVTYSSGFNATNTTLSLGDIYGSQFGKYAEIIDLNERLPLPSLENYLIDVSEKRLATVNEKYMIAAEFQNKIDNETRKINATAFFNNQAYHTPSMTLNAMDNALYQFLTNQNNSISTINHPLPRTVNDKIYDELNLDFEGFTAAFNVLFGMAFLTSSFTLFLVKEKAIKAKHCQFVSGVNPFIFWFSTFCWDMINYLIPVALLIACFASFNITAYVGGERLGYVFLLFLLYGWAVLPFMYILSNIFTVPSTGLVWLTIFNIFSGLATVLAIDILSLPQLNTKNLADALRWVFQVFLPNFCLGQSLEDLYTNYQFVSICTKPEIQLICQFLPPGKNFTCCKDRCGDECVNYQENYLSWESLGIGRALVFLAIQGFVYFVMVFMNEAGVLRRLWYMLSLQRRQTVRLPDDDNHTSVKEDSDVAAERQRIVESPIEILQQTDSLILNEVKKYYGNLLAVDRLSVGIPQGECFGLLGLNGAGKTTTFKMLTGDEALSSGNAWLDGLNVKSNIKEVQRKLGYCPQFDALIDQMTGRETLYMYARLRGVKEKQIPRIVQDLIKALLLQDHADKLVKAYSGGNKRKLSTAVAIIGDPPILFLDEPTTGMDPVARRLLWETLSRVRESGKTLVLTSHSMEEIEALCTRLAVMVNGQFKCLGSPQHLKYKFGEGYTLIARVAYPQGGGPPPLDDLRGFIESTFPGSVLKDIHQDMVHYHITDRSIGWGKLFGTLERAKGKYQIEDYSVSQMTLEQVFITFARAQIPPQEFSRSLFSRCKLTCCFCCQSCRHDVDGDTESIVRNEQEAATSRVVLT